MPRLAPEELLHAPPGETSAYTQARVDAARTRAIACQGVPNAELSGQALREHAALAGGAATFAQAIAR